MRGRRCTFNAIGNLISKSDVGTYSYPAPGQARPHGVTSISGGVINTTFSYDAKGNMIAGNGLTIAYTAFNKPATITRGTTSISFDHDTEHQRYAQTSLSGITLYIAGGGVFAERFAGSGGGVQWTNYLIIGGRFIGIHIEKSDETTATRYFHTDHLGSISVITNEVGAIVERLSYDAWGRRRHPDGTPDPAGAITSEASRGFTGHEQLDSVGLIHMNGRVYDPLLARFGTPDPMTENPFSTQGWNRYSYVGNSPVNFTDPSGYCFMGCFWQPVFRAIGNFFRQNWRAIVQVAATALLCSGPWAPVCAGVISAAVTGISSGNLGLALRAGLISMATAFAFDGVGRMTAGNLVAKVAGHATVGCLSAMASGGRCGPGALAAGVSAAGTPFVNQAFPDPYNNASDFFGGTAASAVLGGLGSVAAGGNFANGAVTAGFGYLFNACGLGRNGCTWLYGAAGTGMGLAVAGACDLATWGACVVANAPIVGVFGSGMAAMGALMDSLDAANDNTRIHPLSANYRGDVEVYHLINKSSGEIDKIGTTIDPSQRYSQAWLQAENVRYEVVGVHNWRYMAYLQENIELTFYRYEHGRLPRLNLTTR